MDLRRCSICGCALDETLLYLLELRVGCFYPSTRCSLTYVCVDSFRENVPDAAECCVALDKENGLVDNFNECSDRYTNAVSAGLFCEHDSGEAG